jgi:arylsulfatase
MMDARETPPKDPRPNVLIILADDLGYSEIGAFGGEAETPNLDALALRGLRLTNFHASPLCSPSRAMLLTGLDNHEAGLGNLAEALTPNQRGRTGYEGYLRPDTATLAELFGAAGYRTLQSGKWHLGLAPEQDPSARGFQHSFALLQASHNHFGRPIAADTTGGSTYREDGRTLTSLPDDFYSSDSFAAKLIDQLSQSRAGPNADQPFFAYLAFSAPHWPIQAPAETITKYRGRYDAGYEALREARLKKQVELGLLDPQVVAHALDVAPRWSSLTSEERALACRRMEVYAAMVDRIDHNVGRVIAALQASGELDNTIILFLSDNGADGMALCDLPAGSSIRMRYDAADNRPENIGAASSFDGIGPGWAEASNAPFWRFKGFESEGGARVVAFLAGPGIKPGTGGVFTSVMDVAPTLLELSGVEHSGTSFAGRSVQPIRGRSWVPWLTGRADRVYASGDDVAAELIGNRAVWMDDWKLTDVGDGRWRLFNLRVDPGETQDLASGDPGRRDDLSERWDRYAREVGVVLPRAGS